MAGRPRCAGGQGGQIWSSDVPNDGNNAGQTSGSVVVEVPAGRGPLSFRAAVRGTAGHTYYGGAYLIVTRRLSAGAARPAHEA